MSGEYTIGCLALGLVLTGLSIVLQYVVGPNFYLTWIWMSLALGGIVALALGLFFLLSWLVGQDPQPFKLK